MNDPEVTMSKAVSNTDLVAYGSAKEVDSHLRLLVTAGAVHGIGAEKALQGFDEVRAMTWRLLNPM